MIHAQIAPASRVAYGEMLGEEPGDWTGEVAAAVRLLGADILYDTPLGADVVAYLEAQSLLKHRVITSCCVGWRAFVKKMGNPRILCPILSPQLMTSVLIRHYFNAPGSIWSVMPCSIKQWEMSTTNRRGDHLLDKVIMTKELPITNEKSFIDHPASSLGMGFGATGGVLKAVLHYVEYLGHEVHIIKEEKVKHGTRLWASIDGKKIKMMRVWGLNNVPPLDGVDFLEVMACPQGCVGGAGQPQPKSPHTLEMRKRTMENIRGVPLGRISPILNWVDGLSHKEKEELFYVKEW